MSTFSKIAEKLSDMIIVRQMLHYQKDLRGENYFHSVGGGDDIDYMAFSKVPEELLAKARRWQKFRIEKDTTAIFAMHGAEPVGCFFVNRSGRGSLGYPFDYDFSLSKGHAYGHGLFVKPEFRSKGIAKNLYLKAFKICDADHRYLDVYVAEEVFAPIRVVERVGFKLKGSLLFIRCFKLKMIFRLRTKALTRLWDLAWNCLKSIVKVFVRLLTPLAALLRKIKLWLRDQYFRLYRVESRTNPETAIAFISKGIYDEAIFARIFGSGYRISEQKRFLKKNIAIEFERAGRTFDMVVADDNFDFLHKNLAARQEIIFIPQWVVQHTKAPFDFEMFKKVSKSKNRNAFHDIKSVQKSGYTYEFTTDIKALHFFHENMYLPYMKTRYGAIGSTKTLDELKTYFKKGGILFVKDKAHYISGAVIEIVRGLFHPMFLGVLNGDWGLVKKDAITALNYFYLDCAKKKGCRSIDLGLSRAFLNDGVLCYKAKWDTEIYFDKRRCNVYAMAIRRNSNFGKAFFLNNPYISLEAGKLIGNVFCEKPPQDYKVLRGYRFKGLSDLRMHIIRPQRQGGDSEGLLTEEAVKTL